MTVVRIGELLVQQGALTDMQVRHILQVQEVSRRPFGDLAERLFGVTAEAIEDAWVQQYIRLAGVVDLDDQEIDIDCLRLLNRRQAWQFRLLPLHRDGQALNMATDADSLIRTLNFASRRLEEPIGLLIAERSQLREFLMKHYPIPQHMAAFAETLQG